MLFEGDYYYFERICGLTSVACCSIFMLWHVKLEHSLALDRKSLAQSWVHSQLPCYIRRVCGILCLCAGESASWRCCWALNKSETCLRCYFVPPPPVPLRPLFFLFSQSAGWGLEWDPARKLELVGVCVCVCAKSGDGSECFAVSFDCQSKEHVHLRKIYKLTNQFLTNIFLSYINFTTILLLYLRLF